MSGDGTPLHQVRSWAPEARRGPVIGLVVAINRKAESYVMELSEKNAAQYLKSRGILAHRVTELGGGISNVVLLVETGEESFILKQSLSQLRVKDQWLADRSRIFREMESLIDAASILPEGSVPDVLWADKANYLFAMTAVNGLCWKNELMAGRVDSAIATRAGGLLGGLMSKTWAADVLRTKYGDLTAFEQLRIDPYYRTIAARHSDVRAQVLSVVEEMGLRRFCLVHGDFSPKNILVSGERVALIDFEVVHFGDPSFDAAFCLSLLLLGWFYQPGLAQGTRASCADFLRCGQNEATAASGLFL